MIAKLISKSYKSYITYSGNIENLKIGEDYLVYGVEIIKEKQYYLIYLDSDYTPRLYDAKNFQIIDPRKSKYWIKRNKNENSFLFEDWVNYDDYLEFFFNGTEYLNLDEYETPVEYFPYYDELLREEFNVK